MFLLKSVLYTVIHSFYKGGWFIEPPLLGKDLKLIYRVIYRSL